MDESDARPPSTHPWLSVDETCSTRSEMFEGVVDRYDGVCDVMQTFTILGQEPTHWGFRRKGPEQLDE